MSITLINPSVVPADKEDQFLTEWNYSTYLYSQMPGFLETKMHKNTGAQGNKFQHVNAALWATGEAAADARRRYTPGEAGISTVEQYPGAFEEVLVIQNLNGLQATNDSVHPIIVFTVPPGAEEEMLKGWTYVAYLLSQKPGFISTRLHKNNGAADNSFQLINIAAWETLDALNAASVPGVVGKPPPSGVQVYDGVFHETFAVKGLHPAG